MITADEQRECYERMRARQVSRQPVSWLDQVRYVHDAEQRGANVRALRPVRGQDVPVSDDDWRRYMDRVLTELSDLREDLELHNVSLTAEEHSTLLHVADELRSVLRGETDDSLTD